MPKESSKYNYLKDLARDIILTEDNDETDDDMEVPSNWGLGKLPSATPGLMAP